MVKERPSTSKTSSRVGRFSPQLKVQNLSPNKDVWLSTIWFFTSPFNSQAGYLSSKIDGVRKKLCWKDASSKNRFFLEQEGAGSTKSRGGKGENNTRVIVWASFGPVSMVVTWLQANR